MPALGVDAEPSREADRRRGVLRAGRPSLAVVDAAVLIPVKDFRQAKARLAEVLSPDDRIRLARWTAERVVRAAAPLPVFVACDDRAVAGWAEACGATVLWRPGMGLNAAVRDGIATLAATGIRHAVVAHSDLARPGPLAHLVLSGGIVLVPDAVGDGTNVMAIPTDCGLEPSYGSQSFGRHLAQAMNLDLPVRVQRDPLLAMDIDTAADLVHPLIATALPTWLRTNPASRP